MSSHVLPLVAGDAPRIAVNLRDATTRMPLDVSDPRTTVKLRVRAPVGRQVTEITCTKTATTGLVYAQAPQNLFRAEGEYLAEVVVLLGSQQYPNTAPDLTMFKVRARL